MHLHSDLADTDFAFLFWFFKLDGEKVDFANPPLMLKFVMTTLSLIVGLFFGLRLAAGRKVALQIGGGLGLLMVVVSGIGFLIYH